MTTKTPRRNPFGILRGKKILIGVLVIFILIIGGIVWKSFRKVVIITDKVEYQSSEMLRLKIKNNLAKNICFSSCYPYYLEVKEKKWQSYEYGECQKPNLAEKCMRPAEIKGFELTLVATKNGLHRLAVPVCIDCKENEGFKETKRFYSNKFIIK